MKPAGIHKLVKSDGKGKSSHSRPLGCSSRPMPSRQERRQAERDATRHAAAQARGAGAGGAAAAGANVNVHPVGDWTTQNAAPEVLLNALGPATVMQMAQAGDAGRGYTRPLLSST